MARVVIQVLTLLCGIQRDALLQQVLVDIHNAAARENFVELIALQLIVASATTDHHGFDVQIIQRVRHTMEQHPVVSDDFVGLVLLARPTLGVAATQVAWGQHSLHAGMPQHGLSGQAHLAEQALRATTREIKHRFAVGTGGLRVADDGHVVAVFNVQQSPGRFIRQAFGHLFVDEVNHLLFDGRGAHAGWRASGLLANELLQHIVGPALHFKAHLDHAHPHELDGFWVGGIEEHHCHRIAGAECFFAHLAQQVAHVHGDVAKVDLHRAWRLALVAHGAVVGHVFKLLPMLDRHAAAGLLFVQKSFDQQ